MLPATTLVLPTEKPTRRVWSVSAAHVHSQCPRRWSYLYGPHQIRLRPLPTDRVTDRQLGGVLHHAIGAAYREADRQARADVLAYPPGGTMEHYLGQARAALNEMWVNDRLPRSGEAAAQVANRAVHLLGDLLAAQPVPPRGAIVEVETRHTLVTSNGLPFVIVPDLVLGIEGGLLVRDWKLGDVSARDPERAYQLCVYVAGLAAVHPTAQRFIGEFYSISKRSSVQATIGPMAVARALDWLEATAEQAEAEDDPAPKPGPQCSDCPFRELCPGPAQLAA
jgi:hypothetical protein